MIVWYFLAPRPGHEVMLFPQQGMATVRKGGSVLSVGPSQVLKLCEGDQIYTGGDSSALLLLLGGARTQLQPDTDVVLRRLSSSDEGLSTIRLEVRHGETWHELGFPTKGQTRYELLTPSARVILSPGRHHLIVSDDGTTRVEVHEGLAKVTAQSTEIQIRDSQYTCVLPGTAPAVPRPIVARFLFVSQRGGNADIWMLAEEGREVQLTRHRADDLAPAWSPDGTKIAFETLRDGNSEVYIMHADGSEQVNLTRSAADDHAPAWSPDGSKIAFESLHEHGRHIYVMNVDGTRKVRLTSRPDLSLAPHWSADGPDIIFTRIDADTNGDGLVDPRDMGAFFFVEQGEARAERLWGSRMIFEQLVFPWTRRTVG